VLEIGIRGDVLAWTDPSAFPSGRTHIESLESIARRCNCALLVATCDDRTEKRGQTDLEPRDNILEYGMFMTAFGRERTALAAIGEPRLPSKYQARRLR
jgi:predicted nucleotide-binding protein